MNSEIVVLGSINMDFTVYGQRLPQPGETLHAERYAMALGGKGCNQAVAAHRLGGRVDLVGRLGDDVFGAMARRQITELGLADQYVAADPEHDTAIAMIAVAEGGENCISVVGGANLALTQSHVDLWPEVFDRAGILLLQLEIPPAASAHAAARVRAAGGRVILDPAPVPPGASIPAALLQATDIVTPNEGETEALVGLRPETPEAAAEAARRLQQMGPASAVVTMGAGGVYYAAPEGQGFVPPFAVSAVDSVAAGDCFNGGLSFALARGDEIGAAVRFAAACGALATTRPGAAAAAPELAEVEEIAT